MKSSHDAHKMLIRTSNIKSKLEVGHGRVKSICFVLLDNSL
jgi:hypothetical protein